MFTHSVKNTLNQDSSSRGTAPYKNIAKLISRLVFHAVISLNLSLNQLTYKKSDRLGRRIKQKSLNKSEIEEKDSGQWKKAKKNLEKIGIMFLSTLQPNTII